MTKSIVIIYLDNNSMISFRYEDGDNDEVPNEDEFDLLMREAEEQKRLEDAEEMRPTKIITDEQRAMIEGKKQEALERRRQVLSQKLETNSSQTNDSNVQTSADVATQDKSPSKEINEAETVENATENEEEEKEILNVDELADAVDLD